MKNTSQIVAIATLTGGLLACGGADAPEDRVDPEAEVAAAAETTAALIAAGEVAGPTSEPSDGAEDVMEEVRAAYGRRMSCAAISFASGVLEVDFGAGCPVHGHTVAGAFTVAYTRTPTAAFTLTLDDLSADGVVRDGTVHLSRGSGAVAADATLLVTDGPVTTEHLFAGTMTPDATGIALEGAARRDDGSQARDLAFTGVYVRYGDCYPSAGQVTVDASGQPTTTVTFDVQTPSTGQVQVAVGRLPAQTVTLPACPR